MTNWNVVFGFFLQRPSYLTQHRTGHSGHALHGRPAVFLRAREGSLASRHVVVQPQPVLGNRAEGGCTAPAPPAGSQESDGQSRQQQQRGLGQSGAPQPPQWKPRHQPRDGLPVLWPLHVSCSAPIQETCAEPPTHKQSGHQRFDHSFCLSYVFFLSGVIWVSEMFVSRPRDVIDHCHFCYCRVLLFKYFIQIYLGDTNKSSSVGFSVH